MYGATASIGFVAGQVLGGVLVEFTSWRAVFLVNVPVGLVALALAPRLLGESRQAATAAHRLDVGGALLITGAVAALVFAVSQGYVLGWASPAVLGALAAAVGGAARRSSPSSGVTPIRWSAATWCGCRACARPAR